MHDVNGGDPAPACFRIALLRLGRGPREAGRSRIAQASGCFPLEHPAAIWIIQTRPAGYTPITSLGLLPPCYCLPIRRVYIYTYLHVHDLEYGYIST